MSVELDTGELIQTTRDQIQALQFKDPKIPFTHTEIHRVHIWRGNKEIGTEDREIEVTLGERSLTRLQAYGMFQLWSRMVDLAGIEQANFYTFGFPKKDGVIYLHEPRSMAITSSGFKS